MDKKLLLVFALTALTFWGLQYFTGSPSVEQGGPVAINAPAAQITPGQPVKVPSTQDLFKPLNTDVAPVQTSIASEKIVIDTELVHAVFSTRGAVLESLDFIKHQGKTHKPLETFSAEQVQKACFLLTFDDQTPVAYNLVGNVTKDGVTTVQFTTEFDGWDITKRYVIYHATYQVDLVLGFAAKSDGKQLHPRLFVKAPYVQEVENNKVDLFSWNEYKTDLEKIELGKHQNLVWHWETPKVLFGAQDKYFVHALVNDPAKFVQRAYIDHIAPKVKNGTQETTMIFEGPSIEKATQWSLTFYMGPKISGQLGAVDERLESLLSYGWLSWLCKLLLQWLMYLYQLLGNFGLAIIALAVLLKLPFTPFSMYARKKHEEYQRYVPTINKIRLKYRHDQKMQTEEVMRFHQEHNISPATQMLGCLPLLIQFPIAIGLYRMLGSHLALYHTPFYGWIVDLSAKDPYYVIPTLMGATMVLQNMMMPQTDEKQRLIAIFMSLVMAVIFASLPAGLALYWFANSLFTIVEDATRKLFFK
ncbi:MAG: membrane protein insertase YidC [Candidatus Babeliales bacterium]